MTDTIKAALAHFLTHEGRAVGEALEVEANNARLEVKECARIRFFTQRGQKAPCFSRGMNGPRHLHRQH